MADKAKQYRVTQPSGNFNQGDVITEEQAGEWFRKWESKGALELMDESKQEAAEGKQDDPGSASRSAHLATGDIDAISPEPAQTPKK